MLECQQARKVKVEVEVMEGGIATAGVQVDGNLQAERGHRGKLHPRRVCAGTARALHCDALSARDGAPGRLWLSLGMMLPLGSSLV